MKLDLTIITMDGFTGAKTERGPVTTTPVSGLGDEAYYFAMASGDRMTLRVKKGSVALSPDPVVPDPQEGLGIKWLCGDDGYEKVFRHGSRLRHRELAAAFTAGPELRGQLSHGNVYELRSGGA
jgi:hypothetical protein